jgi:RNA polymerase sigma factor (sigma-70 family)
VLGKDRACTGHVVGVVVPRVRTLVPDSADDRDQRERRFRALYQENYGPIQAYAMRRLACPEDAADVVAETFTTVWRRLGEVPPPPADRLWLYGVARRVVAGRHRGARRVRNLIARLEFSLAIGRQPSLPGQDPAQDHVLAALARLRPADREVVALVHWEQLSHAEAARVLGCSVNAVAIRVHRAKARLREELTDTDRATRPAPITPESSRS